MVACGCDEGITTGGSKALLYEVVVPFLLDTVTDVEEGREIEVISHPVSELIGTNPVSSVQEVGPESTSGLRLACDVQCMCPVLSPVTGIHGLKGYLSERLKSDKVDLLHEETWGSLALGL